MKETTDETRMEGDVLHASAPAGEMAGGRGQARVLVSHRYMSNRKWIGGTHAVAFRVGTTDHVPCTVYVGTQLDDDEAVPSDALWKSLGLRDAGREGCKIRLELWNRNEEVSKLENVAARLVLRAPPEVRSKLPKTESGMKMLMRYIEHWFSGRYVLHGNILFCPVLGQDCAFQVEVVQTKDSQISISSSESKQQIVSCTPEKPVGNPHEELVGGLQSMVLEETRHLWAQLGSSISKPVVLSIQVGLFGGADASEDGQQSTPSQGNTAVDGSCEPCKKKFPSLKDIGGMESQVKLMMENVLLPLRRPHVYMKYGLRPPRGILLHGPPGTGKSTLARAVAAECEASFFVINGPEVVSEYLGESEATLNDIFAKAVAASPSIIFMDEIDSIVPSRTSGGSEEGAMSQRIVTTLLTQLDALDGHPNSQVVVLAATNRPDAINPALRRPGRFDQEIEVSVPLPHERLQIFEKCIANKGAQLPAEYMASLSESCHGFVGADIAYLCNQASMNAFRRLVKKEKGDIKQVSALPVTIQDMEMARGLVRPSAMREFYVEVPNVRWTDIGGLDEIKQQLIEVVEWPQKNTEALQRIGVEPPGGVLLYGPPGCSKTLLARAVAGESGLNFLSVKGPELLSKWVGETEKAVRNIFRRARAVAPSVIFFDEIDGLVASRERGRGSDHHASERILSQLLAEMDGFCSRGKVVVMAATNRPDVLDEALLRPGRFDRLIFVPLPCSGAREAIFRICLRDTPVSTSVCFRFLSSCTEGYTGAEIASICREAKLNALDRSLQAKNVEMDDFNKAISLQKPRLSTDDMKIIQTIRQGMRSSGV